jgi:hypothetical protein
MMKPTSSTPVTAITTFFPTVDRQKRTSAPIAGD